MLTNLWLGNFIHFKNQEYFKFNKGLNILLGPNHTGKTSAFEAIRRCMSVKLNGGLSNPHDDSKISYVTSTFENENDVIWSSMIRIRTVVNGKRELVTLKFVNFINGKDDVTRKAIDLVDHKEKDLVNKELTTDTFDFSVLSDIKALHRTEHGEKNETVKQYEERLENSIRQYLDTVKCELERFYGSDQTKNSSTQSEKLLQEHVDEEAVVIFPFRSFAKHQWTRSKRDMGVVEKEGVNFDEITLKKEIIGWYLSRSKENSEKTKRLEEKYFDLITGNSLFRFTLVEGHVHVYVGLDPNKGTLLKVPEGVYEAKSAAIVLADPQFKTICMDDAERGMHPQMIERFRDLVLQDIDDKVVLVITHHPTFLAPWNIAKTFFFQRRADGNRYQFLVKPLARYADQIGGKGPQILTSGQFPSLFFAERICWVEGKTEYLFMTALKYVLVKKNSSVLKSYCAGNKEQKKRFRDFLSTLHVVSMDGEAGKCLFREMSQALDLTHYFILDFDALKNNLKKPTKQAPGAMKRHSSECEMNESDPKLICETFGNAFGVQLERDQIDRIKTTNDIVDTLQGHGIFVWKLTDEKIHSTGTIEHAVKRLTDKSPEFEKFLRERKVDLALTKKKKKLKKLFHDQTITNSGITEVVESLLCPQKAGATTTSASKDVDFHRLVTFLMERCDSETPPATDVPERKKRRIDAGQCLAKAEAEASGSGNDGK